MVDADCVAFLRWSLSRLDLRWQGFRKVHGQVCKRLKRRMKELGLSGFAAYRERLEADPDEWVVLDGLCHITISRFFRDSRVFEALGQRVLPEIAARAAQERREAHFWSAGCASGEEPYTLKIIWDLAVASLFPGIGCSIVATDVDDVMLGRARKGCYPKGSLRELPEAFVTEGFDRVGSQFCVRPRHREGVSFLLQDLRSEAPNGPFDLILCRNVAFTYFEAPLQRETLSRLVERLTMPGYLVIGAQERLPQELDSLAPFPGVPQILMLTEISEPHRSALATHLP
jgi:chemotaxis protein methyltransferase CheR